MDTPPPTPHPIPTTRVMSLQHVMGLNLTITNKRRGAAARALISEHESFFSGGAEVTGKAPKEKEDFP